MTEKRHFSNEKNGEGHDPVLGTHGDHVLTQDMTSGAYGNFSRHTVSFYEDLLEQEAAPADPNEVINLGRVTADSFEQERLLQAGVAPSAIETGNVTRKMLLDAGFVFLNRIGDGEKPLIATTVELDDGSVINTRQRTLLTDIELTAVRREQNNFDATTNERIRFAMIDFLQASKDAVRAKSEIKKIMFQEAQGRILERGSEEDITLIAGLFQSIMESGNSYELAALVERCTANLDIARVGGVPVDMFALRSVALQGVPSPFLDSGYHFDANDDVTIYPDDPARTRRLNSVVVHLLSRGLNEQGSSNNGSHDQTYITSEEFVQLLESLDKNAGPYDDTLIETFIVRLLESAKEKRAEQAG